jgi:hypothetical protein
MSSNDSSKDARSSTSATAAAAAVAATTNDATIAQCFHAMQQLTEIFQFTQEQAQDAIDAVGPDVTLAYNHILDSGGEDKGGTIVPVDDCPHLGDCLKVGLDANSGGLFYENVCRHYKDEQEQNDKEGFNRELKKGGMKGEIEEDGVCPSGENWLCVTCSCVRCSRYVNGHFKDHWHNTKTGLRTGRGNIGHCIAVSLEDLSVWCYECNAYLNHSSLRPLLKQLEDEKFGKLIGM